MRTILYDAARTLLLSAALLAIGCTNSRVLIGEDDAGARDGGSPGTPCGPNVCAPGTECCNESCGHCVAPGGSCTEEFCAPVTCGGQVCPVGTAECCPGCPGERATCAGPGGECLPVACPGCAAGECGDGQLCCPTCDDGYLCVSPELGCPEIECPHPGCETSADCESGACCTDCTTGEGYCTSGPCAACPNPGPCAPMDAAGVGPCDAELGVVYDGGRCHTLSGCSCSGADCGRLYPTLAACVEATWSCLPTCELDGECGLDQWCDGCARGSCPFCADCVQACAPSRCATGEHPTCRAVRPECGASGTAIVVDGCWVCVDGYTCERLPDGDCRTTGCPDRHSCTACRVDEPWVCLPPDLACAL